MYVKQAKVIEGNTNNKKQPEEDRRKENIYANIQVFKIIILKFFITLNKVMTELSRFSE